MVAEPTIAERIDRQLAYDHAIVDELDEVAVEWNALAEAERVSWSLDWDQVMAVHLPFLREQHDSGAMSEDQSVRYRRLLQRLSQACGVIRRLRLYPPPVLSDRS